MEDQESQGRQPSFSRMAQLFAQRTADTSSPSRRRSFYTHLAGEDESSPHLEQSFTPEGAASSGSLGTLPMQGMEVVRGTEDIGSPPGVRVDDSMDRCVPDYTEGPAAEEPRIDAAADGPEVVGAVYRVGPHACHLTD
eukprot:4764739-Amphidinium_carterae.1